MPQVISKIQDWYAEYERPISSAMLLLGFVFNAVALKRLDYFWENFWITEHLLVIGACIFLANRLENQKKIGRLHFWFIAIMQFTFGGILSTFLVFYFRSTALAVTWPFLFVLATAFILNERLKRHRSRLVFQISLFYLSLYSFSIYIIPIVLHQIGTWVFLLSGIAGLFVLILFLATLQYFAHERFIENRHFVSYAVTGIFVAVNVLYFLGFVPPIPFSLKDGGVYHGISHTADGSYVVLDEEKDFSTQFLEYIIGEDFHKTPGEVVYAYSAVFSPPNFNVNLIHEWQKYDESAKKWVTKSRISLPVMGGREGGYRTYSQKADVEYGLWRVNIETEDGHVIGRLRFAVTPPESDIVFKNEIKE